MKLKKQTRFDQSMQWLSRTIAIVLVMIAPGIAGSYLDQRIGTQFLTPTGFVIGIILATTVLLVLAKKLAPVAGGKPIPFEDESQPADDASPLD